MDRQFWENRYIDNDTPWALHTANQALVQYMENRDVMSSILIPGAGTSYEVIELLRLGFRNITLCDLSETALRKAENVLSSLFTKEELQYVHFHVGDFFEMTGQFDYIIEQTFFCALPIAKRESYVEKMFDLLKKNGTLFGVLFGVHFDKPGPPFGGSEIEYKALLAKKFYIKELSICTNSVKPRAGTELFFICKKKVNEEFL